MKLAMKPITQEKIKQEYIAKADTAKHSETHDILLRLPKHMIDMIDQKRKEYDQIPPRNQVIIRLIEKALRD